MRTEEYGMDERTIIVKKGSVSSFLTGALLGAVAALLLAPRSGMETREILSEKGEELKGKAVEIAKDTRNRAESTLSTARNKVEDTVRGAKDRATMDLESTNRQLKTELEISEDIENPIHPL
jgi:gas vesicle protein